MMLETKIQQYINNVTKYEWKVDTYAFMDFIYDLSSEGYSKSEIIEVMTNLSTKFEDESFQYTMLTDVLDFLVGFCSTKDKKIHDFMIYFRNKN